MKELIKMKFWLQNVSICCQHYLIIAKQNTSFREEQKTEASASWKYFWHPKTVYLTGDSSFIPCFDTFPMHTGQRHGKFYWLFVQALEDKSLISTWKIRLKIQSEHFETRTAPLTMQITSSTDQSRNLALLECNYRKVAASRINLQSFCKKNGKSSCMHKSSVQKWSSCLTVDICSDFFTNEVMIFRPLNQLNCK